MNEFWDRRTRGAGAALHGTVSDEVSVVRLRDRLERAHFERAISLSGKERVLELGAGAGRIGLWLAPKVAHVTLVESSGELLNAARERALQERLRNTSFVRADVRSYRPEGPFDLIVLFGVAAYLDDGELEELATRCASALAPGGRLVLKEPVTTDGVARDDEREGYHARWRPRERYPEILSKQYCLRYQSPTIAHPIPFFMGSSVRAATHSPAWIDRIAPIWERLDPAMRSAEAIVRKTPIARHLLAPVPVLQDLYVFEPRLLASSDAELSIVVIAYNEEECLASVVAELGAAMDTAAIPIELVLVDDGSRDRTLSIMRGLADSRTQVVPLSPNRGIGGALRAGFDAARGRWITWVPADGQISPESVAQLYLRRREAPMLTTVYTSRADAWYRHAISASLNAIIRTTSGQVAKSGGNYLFERSLWERFAPRDDDSMMISTAFRANVREGGERIVEVPIRARARVAGSSKVLNARTIARTLAAALRIGGR